VFPIPSIEERENIVSKTLVITLPLTVGLLASALLSATATAQTGPQPKSPPPEAHAKAREQLNKGVQAFKNAQYDAAVEHFTAAVELDPDFTTARLYLATAYMQQYIPGADSSDNMKMADEAQAQFEKVLEQAPGNILAIASLGSLLFNEKKLDEAEQWYQKLVSVDPSNKEAYYTLGVIAWTKAFQPITDARAQLGMKPADPGPLTDSNVRAAIAFTNRPLIEAGIKHLEKAIEIDPEYDDAMAYENLLYRLKADLEESPEAYEADIDAANRFLARVLETRKVKAERNARPPTQDPR